MTYRTHHRRPRSTILLFLGGGLLALAAAAAGNHLGNVVCGTDSAAPQRISAGPALALTPARR